MSKVPLIAVVLLLFVAGYFLFRNAASIVRFFAKIITWALVLVVVLTAAWIYQDKDANPPQEEIPLQSKGGTGIFR